MDYGVIVVVVFVDGCYDVDFVFGFKNDILFGFDVDCGVWVIVVFDVYIFVVYDLDEVKFVDFGDFVIIIYVCLGCQCFVVLFEEEF